MRECFTKQSILTLATASIVLFSSLEGAYAVLGPEQIAPEAIPAPQQKQKMQAAPNETNILERLAFPQVGTRVGLYGGIAALAGEITMLQMGGSPRWGWRTGYLYASGRDSDSVLRNFLALTGSVLYRTAPLSEVASGIYGGGGINYILQTTGQRSGQIGFDLSVGWEILFPTHRLFAELGYGTLRTGFSPDYQGVTLWAGISAKP